jgi:alcohol dehydrogenase
VSYDAELSFVFAQTSKVFFGARAADNLGDVVQELGGKRAFIVTDTFLSEKTDLVQRLSKSLGARLAGVWSGVVPDPTAPSVDQGAAVAREHGADLLISLGGGSAIDTAKAMAVVLTEGGKILEHEGYHALTRRLVPHVSVPTTAGTGSEMTLVTVITDPERGQKTFVGSHFLHPDAAVLDPTFTTGMPANLTAATGMDAMSHAVEALVSSLRQPLSDAAALHAIRLIAQNLPRALEAPADLVARGQMLLAAALAGTAFSNAMVSLNHAMAHSLGALHHVHHGTLNAALLPHSMRFFAADVGDRFAPVAAALGVEVRDLDGETTARRAADAMEAFVHRVGLTTRLGELGVPEAGLPQVAELALSDGSIIYSPRPVMDPAEIEALLRQAY